MKLLAGCCLPTVNVLHNVTECALKRFDQLATLSIKSETRKKAFNWMQSYNIFPRPRQHMKLLLSRKNYKSKLRKASESVISEPDAGEQVMYSAKHIIDKQ